MNEINTQIVEGENVHVYVTSDLEDETAIQQAIELLEGEQ